MNGSGRGGHSNTGEAEAGLTVGLGYLLLLLPATTTRPRATTTHTHTYTVATLASRAAGGGEERRGEGWCAEWGWRTMAAAMQPNIQRFFNNPSGALAPPQPDFSGHAFKVFKVE